MIKVQKKSHPISLCTGGEYRILDRKSNYYKDSEQKAQNVVITNKRRWRDIFFKQKKIIKTGFCSTLKRSGSDKGHLPPPSICIRC